MSLLHTFFTRARYTLLHMMIAKSKSYIDWTGTYPDNLLAVHLKRANQPLLMRTREVFLNTFLIVVAAVLIASFLWFSVGSMYGVSIFDGVNDTSYGTRVPVQDGVMEYQTPVLFH